MSTGPGQWEWAKRREQGKYRLKSVEYLCVVYERIEKEDVATIQYYVL